MAKGYYYTRDEYLKKLATSILFNKEYSKKLEGLPDQTIPDQATITNLETLMNDRALLKRVVLVELKKFMLSADAENAATHLDLNNQLGEFIQTSNSFLKYIGRPVLYSFTNFIKSWDKYTASLGSTEPPTMLPAMESPEVPAESSAEVPTEVPAESSAKVPAKELAGEETGGPKRRSRSEPSKPREKSGPGVPGSLLNAKQYVYFIKLIEQNKNRIEGKQLQGKDPNGLPYKLENVAKIINEIPGYEKYSYGGKKGRSLNQAYQDIKEILSKAEGASGSGLQRNKARNNYFSILRGEVAAGNDNPAILKMLEYR